MNKKLILPILMLLFVNISIAQQKTEKWGVFELTLKGPEAGDPFLNTRFDAEFKHNDKIYKPEGFYDGNGVYKVRFMPDEEGEWTYTTSSNKEELNDKTGSFVCTPAPENVHGPVRVRNKYHFAYQDSTAFYPFGTTVYEWAFQPEARRTQTIETLKQSPFNKVRMLLVPPYSGRYIKGGEAEMKNFPFEGTSKKDFDFSRFNPAYFQELEKQIVRLRDIGVEADLILFRPYDKGKWGFDQMDRETNDRFLHYVIARFAAYHNIWWSLANENSFIKQLTDKDWDHYFQVVQKYDPYGHLRSIHNADRIYDYSKPWVTHVSLQYYNAVEQFGVSPLLRDIYKKPIVHDEINYEGTSTKRWGQLTGQEMTFRFWTAYIGGAYATHGETTSSDWVGPGGKLTGESPARIAFLRKIVESGPKEGLNPIDQYYILNAAGKYGEYYLYYFGKEIVKEWPFVLPDDELVDGMRFKVDIIDTWNMTITPVKHIFEVQKLNHYKFTDKDKGVVKIPNKPYMAIRIQLIKDGNAAPKKATVKRNELTDEVQ